MKKIISFLTIVLSALFPTLALAQEATIAPTAAPAPADQTGTLLIIVAIVTVIALVLFFIVKQPKKDK